MNWKPPTALEFALDGRLSVIVHGVLAVAFVCVMMLGRQYRHNHKTLAPVQHETLAPVTPEVMWEALLPGVPPKAVLERVPAPAVVKPSKHPPVEKTHHRAPPAVHKVIHRIHHHHHHSGNRDWFEGSW
jgi:hypothetical protein